MGAICIDTHEYERAITHINKNIDIARAKEDRAAEADALFNLGPPHAAQSSAAPAPAHAHTQTHLLALGAGATERVHAAQAWHTRACAITAKRATCLKSACVRPARSATCAAGTLGTTDVLAEEPAVGDDVL